jgi:hypothetical protein
MPKHATHLRKGVRRKIFRFKELDKGPLKRRRFSILWHEKLACSVGSRRINVVEVHPLGTRVQCLLDVFITIRWPRFTLADSLPFSSRSRGPHDGQAVCT